MSERFETLFRSKNVKVERIVSRGDATPKGKWLRGRRGEWVMVLGGRAKLRFKAGNGIVTMKPGDHLFIPAGTAHRVEWTLPRKNTVWLAVHL